MRAGFIRSATMAADLEQFQQLLNTLLSTDNDVRTRAEVRNSTSSARGLTPYGRRDAASGSRRAAPRRVRAEHVAYRRRVVRDRVRRPRPSYAARVEAVRAATRSLGAR